MRTLYIIEGVTFMKKNSDQQIHLPVAGFARRKHTRVLEAAQALLAAPQPGILDSLNCGKFGRLVSYLRTGVPGLLIVCCGEYAFR